MFKLSDLKYGRNREPRPTDIQVGSHIKINHTCHEEYWDVTGVVLAIDNFCESDDFDYHIKFDEPLESGLDNEFFAYTELDLIPKRVECWECGSTNITTDPSEEGEGLYYDCHDCHYSWYSND